MNGTRENAETPSASDDPPRCPVCGYILIGLSERTCPECGYKLYGSLSDYRVSRHRTPWVAHKPLWLMWGVFWVWFRPRRAFDACDTPTQVTSQRALAFALMVTLICVGIWPVLVRTGMAPMGFSLFWGPRFDAWKYLTGDSSFGGLMHAKLWIRYCLWEIWSITRWWLFFGALTYTIAALRRLPAQHGRRGRSGDLTCRLLLFAPWIFLLEVGYLVGVWIDSPATVPEPASVYAVWNWSGLFSRTWLIRGLAPSFLIGAVYFRFVAGWRWRTAALFAVLLIPLAIYCSIGWSVLYFELFLDSG